MSFDNLNNQPLGFSLGFLQMSFGLGDPGGDEIPLPVVFVPDEEVFDGPGAGVAARAQAPKIGSLDVTAPAVQARLPKPFAGTIKRPGPKIGSIKIKKE